MPLFLSAATGCPVGDTEPNSYVSGFLSVISDIMIWKTNWRYVDEGVNWEDKADSLDG